MDNNDHNVLLIWVFPAVWTPKVDATRWSMPLKDCSYPGIYAYTIALNICNLCMTLSKINLQIVSGT